MKINVWLGIGFGEGASHEDVLELPDTATDEEIEEEVNEWAQNYIETGWRRVDY